MINETNIALNNSINTVVNTSLNATNSTGLSAEIIIPALVYKIGHILGAPFIFPDMIWISIPLLLTMFLKEIYFAKHIEEKFSWGMAFANAIVLFFVSLDLIRYLYTGYNWSGFMEFISTTLVKTLVALLVAVFGGYLMFVDFHHKGNEKIALFLSSTLPVNLAAYFAVICIYTDILLPVSLGNYTLTLLAFFIVFSFVYILFFIIKENMKKRFR
jgi:hypothetical protein